MKHDYVRSIKHGDFEGFLGEYPLVIKHDWLENPLSMWGFHTKVTDQL